MNNTQTTGKILDFDELVSNPEHWFRQATQLLDAAEILHLNMIQLKRPTTEDEVHRRAGCAKGSALLMGLAIENALKGFATAHKRLSITNGLLDFTVAGSRKHNLIAMAVDLGLDLNSEEKILIQRMTDPTTWASKYQTPSKKSSFETGYPYIKILDSDSRTSRRFVVRLMGSSGFGAVSGWPTECRSQ